MNTKKDFPPGWDEKMLLDEPELWDPENYKGHEKQGVMRGNKALQRICTRTKSRLPKLIAQMRWSEFGWPRDVAKRAMGLSGHGYGALEKDLEGRQPQFRPYEQLLECWRVNGVSVGIHDQCLDLLTMPKIFEQKNPAQGEMYDPQQTLLAEIAATRKGIGHTMDYRTMIALYHRIGYDVGHEKLFAEFPSLRNALHSRKDTITVPGASEPMDVVDVLYGGTTKKERQMHNLRREEALGVWEEAKKTQYRSRGIEEPLIELLIAMELNLAENWEWKDSGDKKNPVKPMNLSSEALKACYGLTDLPAQRLMQAECIEWKDIRDIAKRLIEPKRLPAFKQEWIACFEQEQHRNSFQNIAIAAMEEKGLSYKDLSNMLGLEIQEGNRQKPEDERSTRDRPENQVRIIIKYNRQSNLVAIESLLRILARDEAHYQALRGTYEMERERYYARIGANIDGEGLHMRILRELGNVSTKELALHFLPKKKHGDAVAIRKKDLELQKLERDEGGSHAITFDAVFAILEKEIGLRGEEVENALDVLNDFPKRHKKFTSVDQMAANCIRGLKGGASEVETVMRDHCINREDWLLSPRVQLTAEGKFVPPMPTLRVMAESVTDQTLCEEVIADWYNRFPAQLADGPSDFSRCAFTQPITRCLATQIATVESNIIRFMVDRTSIGTATHGTRFLKHLEDGTVDQDEWDTYNRQILRGVGRKPNDIEWKLPQLLFLHRDNVSRAVRLLLPELRKKGVKPTPQGLPGLFATELQRIK